MKKVLIVGASGLGAMAAALTIMAARFSRPSCRERSSASWTWRSLQARCGQEDPDLVEAVKTNPLNLTNKAFSTPMPQMTPGQLGITVDDEASVADLPMTDLLQRPPRNVDWPARAEEVCR